MHVGTYAHDEVDNRDQQGSGDSAREAVTPKDDKVEIKSEKANGTTEATKVSDDTTSEFGAAFSSNLKGKRNAC